MEVVRITDGNRSDFNLALSTIKYIILVNPPLPLRRLEEGNR